MRKIKITITTDKQKYEIDDFSDDLDVSYYVNTILTKYKDSNNFLAFIIEKNKSPKALLIDKTKITAIEIAEVEQGEITLYNLCIILVTAVIFALIAWFLCEILM